MKHEEKFCVETGVLLLGYAYAVSGYHGAALFCGGTAALCALAECSPEHLFRVYPKIVIVAMVQIAAVYACGLFGVLPETAFLALCNTSFAALHFADRRELPEKTVYAMTGVMALFLVLSFCFQMSFEGMDIASSLFCETVLILQMFLPVPAAYACAVLRRSRELTEKQWSYNKI